MEKSFLKNSGIRPRRSAGQNFLTSEKVVARIIEAAAGGPRLVTELGAGGGVLTTELLAAGFTVRAIEKDAKLVRLLKTKIDHALSRRLHLVAGDLRDSEWSWPAYAPASGGASAGKPAGYQIIGNIPYNLSGLILRRVTQLNPMPAQVILLLQREVGQRLSAQVPQMNLLGLACQLWGRAEKLMNVPSHFFWPAPKVSSSLMLLKPHAQALLPLADREAVLKVAGQFFRARRKQMLGVLRGWQGIDVEAAERMLQAAGIAPTARPQEVLVAQWIRLSRAILEPR